MSSSLYCWTTSSANFVFVSTTVPVGDLPWIFIVRTHRKAATATAGSSHHQVERSSMSTSPTSTPGSTAKAAAAVAASRV